jgi:hypothetical protein
MIGVSAVLFAMGWLIVRGVRWIKLPRELRFVWRQPFRLKSRGVVADLPAAILAAAAGPDQQFGVEAAAAR